MPVFAYEALDKSGKVDKGEIEAGTKEEALKKIRSSGKFPRKLSKKASATGKSKKMKKAEVVATSKKRPASIGGVSSKALTTFTRQFSTLIDAGLPIVRSLNILADQLKPGLLKFTLEDIAEDVESGKSLSDAMKSQPKVFDNFYVNMIKAGEIGGVLDVILMRLADFREKAAKLKNKVIAALTYPMAVMGIASCILIGIIVFIVPKFQKMFEDMHIELPFLTQLLIDIADFIMSSRILILVGLIIFMIIGYIVAQKYPKPKYFFDTVKNRTPIFGQIIKKAGVGTFCRTLGTLISSGVSILEALNIIKAATRNSVIQRDIGNVYNSIREGESVAEPLKSSPVFDSMVTNMIAVGEETGELDKMLVKVAETYDDEVDTLVGSLMSLLEPIMVIGMGIAVGFIVIALFMPMVSMMDGIK